ncbi:hypothetical protein A9Q96_14535 [Rhodobacterales bacterium 52_120_T64]|nr:hypothetical protein A9Q96_14535 [Rhodobacterales bacterium 52_120_T64]
MTVETLENLKARSHGISLGIFAADAGNMREAALEASGWGCGIIHFDIMDGVFVPQMTGGAGFVKSIDVGAVRDVHLMIDNPEQHAAAFVAAGADIITVHAEAKGAAEAIMAIRAAAAAAERPVLVGLGLVPDTSPDDVQGLLDMKPDMILVLSLDPRTKNPPDISAACAKLTSLRERFGSNGPILAFDGGVTLKSIDEIAACKPDMIVSGSAVFGAGDPSASFNTMARSR